MMGANSQAMRCQDPAAPKFRLGARLCGDCTCAMGPLKSLNVDTLAWRAAPQPMVEEAAVQFSQRVNRGLALSLS